MPVVVASQTWSLSVPGCTSLKEKRSVVRSLKDRLRARFHVSVAETDLQDVHTRAEIAVALVSSDRRLAESILDKADHLVRGNGRALVLDSRRDFHQTSS
ncbi:MAG TPA: DUF503 domain-containing protein [Longimicrobiales bacterium]|nr:DUF503 domain-containing protein [Longimicrobiales bacterium]